MKFFELDNVLRCAICNWRTPKGGLDICKWCWDEYQEYIQQKPEWLTYMKSYIQKERRRIKRDYTYKFSLDWLGEYETIEDQSEITEEFITAI